MQTCLKKIALQIFLTNLQLTFLLSKSADKASPLPPLAQPACVGGRSSKSSFYSVAASLKQWG
jgi:hypothetical protein